MKRSSIRKAAALLTVLNAITMSSCINQSNAEEVKPTNNVVIHILLKYLWVILDL